jgi:hypothetical protein
MRAAILLCGQMRCFDDPNVLQSVRGFFSAFDKCDIFVSTWSNRGVSYDHGSVRKTGREEDMIEESAIRAAYPDLVRSVRIHDIRGWEGGLDGERKKVYEEGFDWHGVKIKGTSVPQLFTLWDANQQRQQWVREQRESGVVVKYDVVIRCRPDVVFGGDRSWLESSLMLVPNTITAINCKASRTFWQSRVYDIFFYGDERAMNLLCDAYNMFDFLVVHPFENGLHKRDVCRLLYVQAAMLHSLQVRDLQYDACKVYR